MRVTALIVACLLACACGGDGSGVQITSIRGRVCESKDGAPAMVTGEASWPLLRKCREPVEGVRITVVAAGGSRVSAVTPENGWFSLEGVRLTGGEEERLEFAAKGHKSLTLDRIGPGRQALAEQKNYLFVALPRS